MWFHISSWFESPSMPPGGWHLCLGDLESPSFLPWKDRSYQMTHLGRICSPASSLILRFPQKIFWTMLSSSVREACSSLASPKWSTKTHPPRDEQGLFKTFEELPAFILNKMFLFFQSSLVTPTAWHQYLTLFQGLLLLVAIYGRRQDACQWLPLDTWERLCESTEKRSEDYAQEVTKLGKNGTT